MSLGTRIRELRTQKRLTQAELGEIVGLNSYVQIGRYEIGKAKPAADMLSKLAKALDTTTDYLMNDDLNDSSVTAQLTDRELLKQFKEVELLVRRTSTSLRLLLMPLLLKGIFRS